MTTAGPRFDLSRGAGAIAGLTAFIASRAGEVVAAKVTVLTFPEPRARFPQEVTA